jgi:hypothetical protein
VKARVARKNHRVKAELSLHPDRIKSQEEQERKVPNKQKVKAGVARKNHRVKVEPSWHPVRIKSLE